MSLVFVYHERDKNTNSQTNSSIKYISNTYGGMVQNKIYCNRIIINIYFIIYVRILGIATVHRLPPRM